MTEKLREQISALADNELPEGEHELLARRFAAEKYLCLCWERYHLIGEAMRKALPRMDTRGFADRVMAALSGEPAQPQTARRLPAYFGRSLAGMTLAVVVAAVVLVAVRYEGRAPQTGAPSEIVPPSAPLQTTPAAYGMANNAAWNGNAPEVQAELNNYIISHNELSAALSQQGMLPYFYITTYNPRAPAHKQVSGPQRRDRR